MLNILKAAEYACYIIYKFIDFQNYMWIVKNICMCTSYLHVYMGGQLELMYWSDKKKKKTFCHMHSINTVKFTLQSRITQHSLGITQICGTNKREINTHTHNLPSLTDIVFYNCTVQLDTNRISCLKPAGTIFLCAHIQFQKCFGWQTLLLYKWIASSNI